MEKRQHPRIQLPFLVELQHPSFGKMRSVARDISEGGIFVHLENPTIKSGAKLKLTLLNPTDVDNHPTPTVHMVVRHVEDNGVGLEFVNKTSRHLWQSVERMREELQVGRDYFQVHQSAIILDESAQILVVQQHGKWMFPGEYLIVGEEWESAIKGFLASNFSLKNMVAKEILSLDSSDESGLPEAALLKIIHLIQADASEFTMSERYKSFRWVNSRRAVEEITFTTDRLRHLAIDILQRDVPDDAVTS